MVQMRRWVKKAIAGGLVGLLILGKLTSLCTALQPPRTEIGAWLSITSLLFIGPMAYMLVAVRGYNAFRICACGSLLTEAADLFIHVGFFRQRSFFIVEICYISMLCLALTHIEEMFEEKQNCETLPLDGGDSASNYSFAEDHLEQDSRWARFLCASRYY